MVSAALVYDGLFVSEADAFLKGYISTFAGSPKGHLHLLNTFNMHVYFMW